MNDILESDVPIVKIEELLKSFMEICTALGFNREVTAPLLVDSLVIFQKQIFKAGYSLELAVHKSTEKAPTASLAFNLIYNRYPGSNLGITVKNQEIDRMVAQVATAENREISLANYRQFMLQIYLVKPNSYQGEDYLYRVRIEKQKSGPRLLIGVPWMSKEVNLMTDEAIDLVKQLHNLV